MKQKYPGEDSDSKDLWSTAGKLGILTYRKIGKGNSLSNPSIIKGLARSY